MSADQRELYDCASGKSKGCEKRTSRIYCEVFGYKGIVESSSSRFRREHYREEARLSVPICSSCWSWECDNDKLRHYGRPDVAIINGTYYTIGTAKKPDRMNGYGGSWFSIRFNDGREVKTCDLWHGGQIADEFRDRMPDNAVFLDPAGNPLPAPSAVSA